MLIIKTELEERIKEKPMYCPMHEKRIEVKVYEVTNKDGTRRLGLFCPKCFASYPVDRSAWAIAA